MTVQSRQQQAPIRRALGPEWSKLGAAVRRHYDLPSHSETRLEVEGTMAVAFSPVGKLLISVGRLFDALVPYRGRGVPVSVRNWSSTDSDAMFWHRTFRYPGRKPVIFRSRMEYTGEKQIVEYVKYGLGIRMRLSAEGESLRFDSLGYQWDLGSLTLRIPDWALLGRAVITGDADFRGFIPGRFRDRSSPVGAHLRVFGRVLFQLRGWSRERFPGVVVCAFY